MMSDPNFSDHSSSSLDEIIFNRKNGLLICQWNINCITTNVERILKFIITTKNPDIFLLQEVNKLYSVNNVNFDLKGYKPFIMENNYGNVLILARDYLVINPLSINYDINDKIDREINNLNINDHNYKEER